MGKNSKIFKFRKGGFLLLDRKDKSPLVLAHEKASGSCNSGLQSSITSDCTMVLDSLQDEVENKFQPKKQAALQLSQVYADLNMLHRSARVAECGSWLEYYVEPGKAALHRANFCKDRLCPMCNWRRSLKIFGQVSRVMDVLEKDKYSFLFLTLTVKNCHALELPDTVQALFDGWRNLYRDKTFKKAVAGSFRSLEVTLNRKTGLYHPHFHVILAVTESYWHRDYISQAAWADLWRSCCGLDYVPVVDIRKIKSDSRGLSGAVAEVAKYSVKSADYLRGDFLAQMGFVKTFLCALSRRRLAGFTGCFASVRKQLCLDDVEDGDLVVVDGEQLRDDVAHAVVRYAWRSGFYVRE